MRVVNMRGVDLNLFPFDFDLTFSVLLMHPDGTIYHTYGGRDHRSPDRWLNTESFRNVLEKTLEEHATYAKNPHPPKKRPRRVIEKIPAFQRKDKGECIHCHSVFPALHEDAKTKKAWKPSDLWVHPPPGRIGLDLDTVDQARVVSVTSGSPAHGLGLRIGDRLLRVGTRKILTVSDLSRALHEADPGTIELPVSWRRGDVEQEGKLALEAGWKTGDPLAFSWRSSKWGLLPAPGFGGRPVSRNEKIRLGIPERDFAFRVSYLVTWGENARFGRAVRRAGLRKDDVVVSVGGKRDFASVNHFHSWWRLEKKVGDEVAVEILRKGKPRTFRVGVLK